MICSHESFVPAFLDYLMSHLGAFLKSQGSPLSSMGTCALSIPVLKRNHSLQVILVTEFWIYYSSKIPNL